MEIAIIILGIAVAVLGYATFNLLRKSEKYEDIIVQYDSYIAEFNKQIDIADERLKKLMKKVRLKVMMKLVGFLNK